MAETVFVDLDGTLLRTDTLWEGLVTLARTRPLAMCCIPGWLWKGRAHFKRCMANCVDLDIAELPLRTSVMEFLSTAKRDGATLVLATAADTLWAQPIADHVGCFQHVIASDGKANLKGKRKLEAIQAFCASHDIDKFAYVGDSSADVPIWNRSFRAILVNPSGRLLKQVYSTDAIHEAPVVLRDKKNSLAVILKAIRVTQWAKNLLLFVPLTLAHEFASTPALIATILAFGAFSACASSVYLLNDLLDLPSDRRHPRKRHRPLAAGELSIASACVSVIGLLSFGFALASTISLGFLLVMSMYFVVTLLYSVWLKRKVLVDVLILASLYTLRVIAGGVAADIAVSEWLLAFCMFLFFSLGFVKRYSELTRLLHEKATDARGRGYQTSDVSLIETMGIAGGLMAVLVFALYIHSDDVSKLYEVKWPLWLMCPFLIYWVGRIWFQAKNGHLREDPIVFAITDKISLATGGIIVLLLILAKIGLTLPLNLAEI